ncbi:MAG: hypothetical protein SCJ97_11445 [Bacillota bacterium]|nr:hypothetical protein [Bacillota bacterium]
MNEDRKTGFFDQYKTIILYLIPAALLAYYLISRGIIENGLWLFPAICLLMHFFMMKGMHGKGH